MLLIPWCNLICSELVHSILLFKVSLIRVHLHVFKKMQLQSSKFCMCVTSAEKFKKRQSWKMWPVFLYFAKQPLSSLYREVWRSGKGDRVKERAYEWVESELCIVKKKSTEVKTYIFKKTHLIGALFFFLFWGGTFFVWERRGSYNTRVIKRSKREQRRSILERGWQKKSLKHLKSRSKSKSNLKNFLESVYSNLKKSYKLLLDTSFLLKTFQGISRETCCGKIFLDFNFLNSMCNEIEGNIDLRKCSSILGILEKPVIPRSN